MTVTVGGDTFQSAVGTPWNIPSGVAVFVKPGTGGTVLDYDATRQSYMAMYGVDPLGQITPNANATPGSAAYELSRTYYSNNPSQRFQELTAQYAQQHGSIVGSSGTLTPAQQATFQTYNTPATEAMVASKSALLGAQYGAGLISSSEVQSGINTLARQYSYASQYLGNIASSAQNYVKSYLEDSTNIQSASTGTSGGADYTATLIGASGEKIPIQSAAASALKSSLLGGTDSDTYTISGKFGTVNEISNAKLRVDPLTGEVGIYTKNNLGQWTLSGGIGRYGAQSGEYTITSERTGKSVNLEQISPLWTENLGKSTALGASIPWSLGSGATGLATINGKGQSTAFNIGNYSSVVPSTAILTGGSSRLSSSTLAANPETYTVVGPFGTTKEIDNAKLIVNPVSGEASIYTKNSLGQWVQSAGIGMYGSQSGEYTIINEQTGQKVNLDSLVGKQILPESEIKGLSSVVSPWSVPSYTSGLSEISSSGSLVGVGSVPASESVKSIVTYPTTQVAAVGPTTVVKPSGNILTDIASGLGEWGTSVVKSALIPGEMIASGLASVIPKSESIKSDTSVISTTVPSSETVEYNIPSIGQHIGAGGGVLYDIAPVVYNLLKGDTKSAVESLKNTPLYEPSLGISTAISKYGTTESKTSQYNALNTAYTGGLDKYNTDLANYNTQLAKYNAGGKTDETAYNSLLSQQSKLESQQNTLKSQYDTLTSLSKDISTSEDTSLFGTIGKVWENLNIGVSKYTTDTSNVADYLSRVPDLSTNVSDYGGNRNLAGWANDINLLKGAYVGTAQSPITLAASFAGGEALGLGERALAGGVAKAATSSNMGVSTVGRVLSTPLASDIGTLAKFGAGAYMTGAAASNIISKPTSYERGKAIGETAVEFAGFGAGYNNALLSTKPVLNPYTGKGFFSGKLEIGPLESASQRAQTAIVGRISQNPKAYSDVAALERAVRFVVPEKFGEPNIEEASVSGKYAPEIKSTLTEQPSSIMGSVSVREQYSPEIVKSAGLRIPKDVDVLVKDTSKAITTLSKKAGITEETASSLIDVHPFSDYPGYPLKGAVSEESPSSGGYSILSDITSSFLDPYRSVARPRGIEEVITPETEGYNGALNYERATVQVGRKASASSLGILNPERYGYRFEKDIYDLLSIYQAQRSAAISRGVSKNIFSTSDKAFNDLMRQEITYGTVKGGDFTQKFNTQKIGDIYNKFYKGATKGEKTVYEPDLESLPSFGEKVSKASVYPTSLIIKNVPSVVGSLRSSSSIEKSVFGLLTKSQSPSNTERSKSGDKSDSGSKVVFSFGKSVSPTTSAVSLLSSVSNIPSVSTPSEPTKPSETPSPSKTSIPSSETIPPSEPSIVDIYGTGYPTPSITPSPSEYPTPSSAPPSPSPSITPSPSGSILPLIYGGSLSGGGGGGGHNRRFKRHKQIFSYPFTPGLASQAMMKALKQGSNYTKGQLGSSLPKSGFLGIKPAAQKAQPKLVVPKIAAPRVAQKTAVPKINVPAVKAAPTRVNLPKSNIGSMKSISLPSSLPQKKKGKK